MVRADRTQLRSVGDGYPIGIIAPILPTARLPLPPIFLEGQAEIIIDSVQNSPKQDDVIGAIKEAQEMGEGVEYTQVLAESPDNGRLECLQLFSRFIDIEYSTEGTDGEDIPSSFRELCENPDYDSGFSITDWPGTYKQFVKNIKSLGFSAAMVPRSVEEDEDAGTFSADIEVDYKSQTYWYDLHRIIIRRAN